jgi:hypothetical protein
MKIKLILAISFLMLNSCITATKNPTGGENEPLQVRKSIKDVDYRVKAEPSELKKRVLVLPFLDKNEANRPQDAREQARTAFVDDLIRSSGVIVVPLEQLKVAPEKYIKNGEYDLKKLAQESQKQGFTTILEGQIIDVKLKNAADQIGLVRNISTIYEVIVRMRIVNVRTENEVFNTVKTVTLEEDNKRVVERVANDQFFVRNPDLLKVLIKDAFLDFTPQIQEALIDITWEGRIAAIRGEKIYLNVGRISGVQIGDLLKVVEDGSELYDPEIGYHLGRIRGRTKGTLEIVSFFGNDGSVAVMHSGANFKESDRVETYNQ